MTYVTNFTRRMYAASLRPDTCNVPKGLFLRDVFPYFFLIGVFNGGSLFPSPRRTTSTQSEAASS